MERFLETIPELKKLKSYLTRISDELPFTSYLQILELIPGSAADIKCFTFPTPVFGELYTLHDQEFI